MDDVMPPIEKSNLQRMRNSRSLVDIRSEIRNHLLIGPSSSV